jgi:hypothetical protein
MSNRLVIQRVCQRRAIREYSSRMSPFAVVLLVAAAVLVGATGWPRLAARFGSGARSKRSRERRKENLRVVRPDSEEFARAVERDLAALPTIDERDAKRR